MVNLNESFVLQNKTNRGGEQGLDESFAVLEKSQQKTLTLDELISLYDQYLEQYVKGNEGRFISFTEKDGDKPSLIDFIMAKPEFQHMDYSEIQKIIRQLHQGNSRIIRIESIRGKSGEHIMIRGDKKR